MQSVIEGVEYSQKYIDYTEPKFLETLEWSLLCCALWIVIPHLEFKYKILSRIIGNNQERANDFLAYVLIYTGIIRNNAFNEAIKKNLHCSYGVYEIPIKIGSYLAMIFGTVLVYSSFYRLGMRNMFFGDHFGFLMKEKVTAFPYNYVNNPQYVGLTALFIGFSVCNHSPAGVFLSIVIYLLYKVLYVIEEKKVKIFYPDTKIN